jgi:hypothetical protein
MKSRFQVDLLRPSPPAWSSDWPKTWAVGGLRAGLRRPPPLHAGRAGLFDTNARIFRRAMSSPLVKNRRGNPRGRRDGQVVCRVRATQGRYARPGDQNLDVPTTSLLLRPGLRLEYATLGWNVLGVGVLAWSAITARSVALAGFGLDSLIEIAASAVVVWELTGFDDGGRERRALRLIGVAFVALALYLAVQSSVVLAAGYHAGHSLVGIVWTAASAAAMFALAAGKDRTGRASDNPVLRTEGRVTFVDGVLATAEPVHPPVRPA